MTNAQLNQTIEISFIATARFCEWMCVLNSVFVRRLVLVFDVMFIPFRIIGFRDVIKRIKH